MLRFLSSLTFFLLSLFTILLGLSFALLNAEMVTVNYYVGQSSLPLSLLLVCTLGLGILLGLMFMGLKALSLHATIRRLRARARVAETEIENLRAIPLQE